MIKRFLWLFSVFIVVGSCNAFWQNSNISFTSFMKLNYWLTISKDFANVNKYCKIDSLNKKLQISIWTCNKRIRTFVQESYDVLLKKDNTLNIEWALRPIYITLNLYLTNKLSNQSNEWQIKNVRNSITSIIKNQPNLSMSIDWDIAIQMASLHVILNDYIINSTSKASTNTATATTNTITQSADSIKDCKNDYDCLIEQSKTCSPSKITIDIPMNLFWIISTTTMYYEIKGTKNNKCSFYMNTIKQTLSYSPEIIQKLLAKWLTIDKINKDLEEKSNSNNANVKGLDWTCNVTNTFLTKIISNWKEWTMSSEDLTSKYCIWKLFPKNQFMN